MGLVEIQGLRARSDKTAHPPRLPLKQGDGAQFATYFWSVDGFPQTEFERSERPIAALPGGSTPIEALESSHRSQIII